MVLLIFCFNFINSSELIIFNTGCSAGEFNVLRQSFSKFAKILFFTNPIWAQNYLEEEIDDFWTLGVEEYGERASDWVIVSSLDGKVTHGARFRIRIPIIVPNQKKSITNMYLVCNIGFMFFYTVLTALIQQQYSPHVIMLQPSLNILKIITYSS